MIARTLAGQGAGTLPGVPEDSGPRSSGVVVVVVDRGVRLLRGSRREG